MTGYITTKDASVKWGITTRRVQLLCSENRILGATKHCGVWFIPSNTPKPPKLKSGRKEKKNLNVLSLFSGCGGMDLGFEGSFPVLKKAINSRIHIDWKCKKIDTNWVLLPSTRFKTVFANDIRPDAKSAWINYFCKRGISPATYCLDSIVDLVKLHKENSIDIFPKNVDLVTGGFPCQDFSIAGNRQGFDSKKSHLGVKLNKDTPSIERRGQLYMWMREVISITQPNMFIAENVKGLANLNDVKEVIEHDFSTICDGGYLVIPARILHAADFGVPQNRERIIFFGFKKSALCAKALKELSAPIISSVYDPYPQVTHGYTPLALENIDVKPFVTVRDAFMDLLEPNFASDISQQNYSKAKYMGRHCQGQTEVDLSGIGPTIRSEHHGNIEYRRLSIEHGGKYQDELDTGLSERRLTIRECARIQTFPDEYDFIIPAKDGNKSVSASDAYKIIGNAVPPLLAFHIAKRLEANWDLYFSTK